MSAAEDDAQTEADIRTTDRIYGGEFGSVRFLLRLLDAERARADEAEEFLDAALNAEAKQTARAEALSSALQRTEANFKAAVNGRPVRDMAENLAENEAALNR